MTTSGTIDDVINFSSTSSPTALDVMSSNMTSSQPEVKVLRDSLFVDATTIVLYVLIGIFGALGNAFAIFILTRSASMRKKLVNVFLINQSVIDLVGSFFLIGFGYYKADSVVVSFTGIRADIYCKIVAPRLPMWSVFLSSSWNLVCVNIERYISVAYPIFHKTSITKKHIIGSFLIIWLFGPFVKFFVLFLSSGYKDGACRTGRLWPSHSLSVLGSGVNISFHFFLPLIIMALCYIQMIRFLRSKVSAATVTNDNTAIQSHSQSKGRNILKTLAMVSLVFIICWAPNNFIFLLYYVGYIETLGGSLYHFSVYLVFLNSCLNPIIYSAQYKDFQHQIRKIFCKEKIQTVEVNYSANSTSGRHM